jgi:hypothetical protein
MEDNNGSTGGMRPLRENSANVQGTFTTESGTEDEIEDTGGDEEHTHGWTGDAMDFAVAYVDGIIATVD